MREEQSIEDVDLVALHELADLRERHRRKALRVLDDHLDLAAGNMVAMLFEVHHEAIHHVLADLRGAARHRGQETDLDRRFLSPGLPAPLRATNITIGTIEIRRAPT